MNFHIIIPARYNSSRFPGKVLADLCGKTVLQRVYEIAEQSQAESVVIATDDERVKSAAEAFGATVCMTSDLHESGSERIAEVINLLDYEEEDIVVGLQADEPFIPPSLVQQLALELEEHEHVKVASLCKLIQDVEDVFNPNITKVVFNRRKQAMYFSRAPIPYERENFLNSGGKPKALTGDHYRHIGLYAYRANYLLRYVDSDPAPAEKLELLEQLRMLWDGVRIQLLVTKDKVPPGIDTKDDLEKARKLLEKPT